MRYVTETSLEDFPAWSGGLERLERAEELGLMDDLENLINEYLEMIPLEDTTDTTVNDILWFDEAVQELLYPEEEND